MRKANPSGVGSGVSLPQARSTTDLVRPHGVPPSSSDHLTVTVVEDPLRVRHGFPISAAYIETFWLSHVGASAICLLRLFDRFTRHQPNHRTFTQKHLTQLDMGNTFTTALQHIRNLPQLI